MHTRIVTCICYLDLLPVLVSWIFHLYRLPGSFTCIGYLLRVINITIISNVDHQTEEYHDITGLSVNV